MSGHPAEVPIHEIAAALGGFEHVRGLWLQTLDGHNGRPAGRLRMSVQYDSLGGVILARDGYGTTPQEAGAALVASIANEP